MILQGEFVSSEKLENIYLSSVFVDQVYITCADTKSYEQTAVFAVVIPCMDYLRKSLASLGLDVTTSDDVVLCDLSEAVKLVHDDLVRIGKQKKLRGFEIPHAVLLDSEPLTVENGCLTSSEKVARVVVQKRYQERVDHCISKLAQQDGESQLPLSVHSLIAQILGLQVDTASKLSERSFLEHGGDSLTAMRFTAVVKELFGVDISVGVLLSSDTSLDQLNNMISGKAEVMVDGQNVLDLMRQDMSIELPKCHTNTKPSANNIFLTGSTGFLGCFLLSHLLTNVTDEKIYCLVRCENENEGIEKLEKCFTEYDLPVNQLDDRVVIVCGDLEKERFGLDWSNFCALSDSVSSIYHLGAHVNHVLGYEALRRPNVLGTIHVLELAARNNIPLHHVSSISVADCLRDSPIPEIACEPESLSLMSNAGGYAQSKWVSEYLVWCTGQQGLPVVIYRPGMISWSIINGKGNKKDWFYRLLQGVMELGFAPDPSEAAISLVPVDFLAQSICSLSHCVTEQGAWAKVFHFDNPNKLSFKSMFRSIDAFRSAHNQTGLQIVPYEVWWRTLQSEIRTSQSSSHSIEHRNERLDKLSGLLLFTGGVPTDTTCYGVQNSINIGKIRFPLFTDESFAKFVSVEFN